MADLKISELTEKTAILDDDDLFVVVDTTVFPNTTKKIKGSGLHPLSGFMQYSHASSQISTSTVPTFTKVIVTSDIGSFANSIFTKLNTTDIQCDFAGRVRVTYSATAFNASSNDVGVATVILKNGSAVAGTLSYCVSKTAVTRSNSTSVEIVLPCAVNDTFSMGLANSAEGAGDDATISANEVLFKVEKYNV